MDFTEARERVLASYALSYEHPVTEPYGYEDAEHFNVIFGPREWLRDGDWDFIPPDDDRAILVRKDNGAVEEVHPLEFLDKFRKMTPVGTGHPKDEDDD